MGGRDMILVIALIAALLALLIGRAIDGRWSAGFVAAGACALIGIVTAVVLWLL
jgi:Na+/proline symporter